MTKKEIKDLLKLIISKCDLVINNENYTADDYAQDKIEDIAEMCHRVLDGQFGKIPDIDTPSNLDEAAWVHVKEKYGIGNPEQVFENEEIVEDFKAGAEWMAEQGKTCKATRGVFGLCYPVDMDKFLENIEQGESVIIQIRKK